MRPPASTNKIVSKVMRSNKCSGTSIELKVRAMLRKAGFKGQRYNYKKLPGKPDIAFADKKVAVIINGCFWHGCKRCVKRSPRTNKKYWSWKIENNRKRDKRNSARLKKLGWRARRVWEHDVKSGDFAPFTEWLKDAMKSPA